MPQRDAAAMAAADAENERKAWVAAREAAAKSEEERQAFVAMVDPTGRHQKLSALSAKSAANAVHIEQELALLEDPDGIARRQLAGLPP